MRKLRITEDALELKYKIKQASFWDLYQEAFEKIFYLPENEDDSELLQNKDKVLGFYSKNTNTRDWAWYINERYDSLKGSTKDSILEKMLKWFMPSKNPKPVFRLYGIEGSGKTTIIEYFFDHYLKVKGDIFISTCVFKLDMSKYEYSDESSVESDFDERLYKLLINTFKDSCLNLNSVNSIIEMVRLEFPFTEGQNSYLDESHPPKNYKGQLDWVFKQVGENSENKYAVFNRLAISFLRKNSIQVVIVLDNLDRIKLENQELVWQMVRIKSSRMNLRFVITSRPQFINQSRKEEILYSFIIEKTESVEVNPPPLCSILEKRKLLYFRKPSASLEVATSIADNTYTAKNNCPPNDRECLMKTCPDEILSNILDSISREKIKEFIESISNYSITKQLKVVERLLQYPFCDWMCLGEAVDEKKLDSIISSSLIIDAAARAGNSLCNTSEPFFVNIYNANSEDNFSNSLCMFFIMKIIYDDGDIARSKLCLILQKFGHKKTSIDQALEELAKYKLISCDYSDKDDIRYSQNESVFVQYLINIIFSLFYVQAMAYVTPMKKDYLKNIPLPERTDNDRALYKDRITAAYALIQQIEDDMKNQAAYIKKHEEDYVECQKILKSYNIEPLLTDIKNSIKQDIPKVYVYNHTDRNDVLEELLSQFN